MTLLQRPAVRTGTMLSVVLVIVTVACFQLGSALAKPLFVLVDPLGVSALRMGFAALFLLLASPPRPSELRSLDPALLVLFGLCVAGLNSLFYMALLHIPLGIAVTIDFLGPLSVAVLHSRRAVDFLWVALAIIGVLLFMPIGPLSEPIDLTGVGICLLTAASWACYILCGRKLGSALPLGQVTALGMAIAALVLAPFGIVTGGAKLVSLQVWPIALVIAAISTALPFRLEMIAMQRLPARVFGVLMSLEPAFAALYGWLLLGETLNIRQLAAILCVMAASAGVTLTAAPEAQPAAI